MSISERFQGANIIDAGRRSPYWGEHVARYVFALPHVEGKAVLDIACGTGYGMAVMGEIARFVCGVDVDPIAIYEAQGETGKNSAVTLGDALGLPFPSETFDVVTTFETIEHLNDRPGFLRELYRVLRPDGTLLLSTPNANYTQPVNGKPENPFHVHEYDPAELKTELERVLSIETYLGQSLNDDVGISPFEAEQRRMPGDVATQTRLAGWKVMNKMPLSIRESVSQMLWGRPFYPTEMDYNFSESTIDTAPTLVAVCKKA